MAYEQAMALLKCLAGSHPKKTLEVSLVVGRPNDPKCDNINVDAEGYAFTFTHALKRQGGCFIGLRSITTPGGMKYTTLGRDPYKELNFADQMAILGLMAIKREDTVTVETLYVVMKDGCAVGQMYDKGVGAKGKSFPSVLGVNRYYDRDEAEDAARKFREYLEDLEAKPKNKKKK